jgi:hypothetical protein
MKGGSSGQGRKRMSDVYSWLEEYLVRLEGKEARQAYYAYL